jgi:hypothetical protein
MAQTVGVPTLFTIGSSLNICVLIATATYVSSYLLYVSSVSRCTSHCSLSAPLSTSGTAPVPLSRSQVKRERQMCVCACVRACTCTHFLCVCVSQDALSVACLSDALSATDNTYSLSVCLSLRLLCLRHLPVCPR